MLQPLAGQVVLRARQGFYWHMDETRWPMFLLVYGEVAGEGNSPKTKKKWYAWVVVGEDATAFLLEPTRSGDVPETFFPKGTEGILNVDRYKGYFGLLGPDWKIKLAFCWSHQRRDFVNLAEGSRGPCKVWAQEWVGLINQLFKANRQRRKAWFKDRSDFSALDQEVRRQVQEIRKRLDNELAGGQLAPEQEKILKSMRRHWEGLTLFVEHPHVPMDNNAAERALRALAVARKNFYGSRSKWSGELAMGCFTILATSGSTGSAPGAISESIWRLARAPEAKPRRSWRNSCPGTGARKRRRLGARRSRRHERWGSPALLRARVQCGGVGPHPAVAGTPTGSRASSLVAPCLSGLGMAQRLGPGQGDELPSGPAPDGEGRAHWLAPP
jgi:hypothetical protein